MSQPYGRVFNFAAGPSTLPVPVLEQARDDLLNYKGSGMSVMEMSHRAQPYETIIGEAEDDLRTLAGIPDNYKVLFLQGGASLQFSMVPMCFLGDGQTAEIVMTGSWAKKALDAAKLVGQTKVVWDGKPDGFRDVPTQIDTDPNAAYVHTTGNETIQGVQFKSDPIVNPPLVCDMSSDILSRPFDVSKYALVYAGAQKNMGPAGVCVVIIRDDMLAKVPEGMAPMLDYRLQAENGSMYNTPPCWTIYICGLVFKYLLERGGLEAQQKRNAEKAAILYNAIDQSGGFFTGHAKPGARSTMNVTFTLATEELTKAFLKETAAQGLSGLKGHRSVGGLRASIYNAFPKEGCELLADMMKDFAKRNG